MASLVALQLFFFFFLSELFVDIYLVKTHLLADFVSKCLIFLVRSLVCCRYAICYSDTYSLICIYYICSAVLDRSYSDVTFCWKYFTTVISFSFCLTGLLY